MTRVTSQDIDSYVDIRSGPDRHEPTSFYEKWLDQSSAKHATPELVGADVLRRMYLGYSLIVSDDHRLSNLLTLPGVTIHSSDSQGQGSERLGVSNVRFVPTSARDGPRGEVTGALSDYPLFGLYKLTWNNNEFVVYITKIQNGHVVNTICFILHDGPEQKARDFLLAAFLDSEQARDEIWVFNRGHWSKDKKLWLGIKDSIWDNIVMKEESKEALQKDVYGFFTSETTYKKLSIPWKRGLIIYGPPGNGKTISIKAIMKTCFDRGFTPLYVKSLQSPCGEVAIQDIFCKARQLSPSVLVLEDLDSLINDRNRSFFLNELDGLEGNDGLLVIGSTNHFDGLDPGLSNRPGRFDRKYLFDDPDYEERVLYVKFWQEKLKDNDGISFPESIVKEAAELTQGFSFAYLKEAFVSTLVRMNNANEDERVEFSVTLKSQIMILRKELRKEGKFHVVPQTSVLPQNDSDEYTLPAEPPSSQEGKSPQRYRDSVHRFLPTDISPTDVSDDSGRSELSTTAVRASSTNSAKPSTAQSSSARSVEVHVLPAPASAYPQVMPGSLPPKPVWRSGPVKRF